MTTTNETESTKAKKAPDFYVFHNGPKGEENKIAGRVYRHAKGNGFTILVGGKSYAAFPARPKAPQAETTEGKSA